MSANFPTRCRTVTIKCKSTDKRVALNRDGNKITEIDVQSMARTEHEFASCAEARRMMNSPAAFVK